MSHTKSDRRSIYVGYTDSEPTGFAVSCKSALNRMSAPIPVHGLVLERLREQRLYYRLYTVDKHTGQLWDVISDAAMSTKFAISRFLTPILAKEGWAMFVDCDVMFRVDPVELFDSLDDSKALMCVKHTHVPKEDEKVKKGGLVQTSYPRKNWSSVMFFNCDHPANKKLTVHMINTLPGRDLHRFCWLEDDEIGELPVEYNYLVGVTKTDKPIDPKIVHWTLGSPEILKGQEIEYESEFYNTAYDWAEAGTV